MPFLAQEHYVIPTKDILSWTFDDFKGDWDDPMYIDGWNPDNNSISTRQARTLIRQLAAGLQAIGLQKGDCVCVHSFNDVHYPILFLGIVAAGGVFAGTIPGYTPYELAHTLKTAKVKYVFAAADLVEPVLKAAKVSAMPKEKILIFNPSGGTGHSGHRTWADLLKHGEKDWVRFDDENTANPTEAARLFSSGTTGLPKAATLTHYNLIAQHALVYEANPRPWRAVRLLALPMFHAATAPSAFCTPLRNYEKAVVLPRFDLEKWFWAIENYQVTDVAFVPPIAVVVMNSPLNKKFSLKSAKIATVGAAPLDKGPQARIQALLGRDVPFTQVWGMTETSCVCVRFPYPEEDTTGSVGKPIPNVDIKLVDDADKDITGYDLRGELCVRGPTIIPGYFENTEANARDFDSEGFFHTGDIAYCDGKTKLWYIVDRKKELIKVRAFQVAPPELESVLLGHPDIVDAAVIGVPDPKNTEGSELPRAYLVRRSGEADKPSQSEVHKYMRERLASYKMLLGGVVFVDTIPKNASGKILKRILRDQAKKEMGAKL